MTDTTTSRPLPLQGIRGLDVSQLMAGPFACMLLADLGADVIKVEPPDTGDQTRGAMGFKMKGPDSMGFLNMNRNKRSLALDLKSDEGREFFYQLAQTADVIVENYRPGVVQRLKIDYETIRRINPRIVYVSISGFGQSGPWASRPGFDLMAQAMSGETAIATADRCRLHRTHRRRRLCRVRRPPYSRPISTSSAGTSTMLITFTRRPSASISALSWCCTSRSSLLIANWR